MNISLIIKKHGKFLAILSSIAALLLLTNGAMAAEGGAAGGFGKIAAQATKSISSIGKLVTAGSYLGGLAFSISAIMKFKQHKDNPTQVPVGTPIALVFIAAALLFLPSILTATGSTLFVGGGDTAGPSGTIFKTSS